MANNFFIPHRSRRRRGALVLAAVAAIGLVPAAAVAGQPEAAPRPELRKLAVVSNFADPGFAKFGSTYYLYRTAEGFDVSTSTQPERGYSTPEPSMSQIPEWVGRAPSGGRHLWAPHVFSVPGSRQPLYVMYFSGYYPGTAARPWGANCIGVATSASPLSGFVARPQPICAGAPQYQAIDPTMYRDPSGRRYLVFKRHDVPNDSFAIRAIQMDSRRGIEPVPGGLRRTLASSTGTSMEAPSLIRHGHRVWLFLARRNWLNCSYATDAWSAKTVERGRFTRAGWVMTSASTGLCGPGGASVLRDGAVTRIAFHAWKSRDPRIRQTWVATLRWRTAGAKAGTPRVRRPGSAIGTV